VRVGASCETVPIAHGIATLDVIFGSVDWSLFGDCDLEKSPAVPEGVGVAVIELIMEAVMMQEPVKDPFVVSFG